MIKLLTIKEALHSIRNGITTTQELYDQCAKRIEALKILNALITKTTPEQQHFDSRRNKHGYKQRGILEGIPVVVKDNFCTEGVKTSCASKMLDSYRPPYTATVVQKLQAEGAVVAGKANMDEFAMGCGSTDGVYGPVRNPWNYDFKNNDPQYEDWHIAGGSSGGSAVAVATGMAFAALGSDTGGSTRNPASLVGVVGLKPTYGLLSRHGLVPLVNSMDVPGILTRSVDDAALMLNILAGHDPLDSTTVTDPFHSITLPEQPSVRGLRIGIPKEYHVPGLSPDILAAWEWVADLLDSAGATLLPVSLPHTQHSIVCYTALCCAEVASNMARYDGLQFGHRALEESSTEALYAQTRHEGFNEVVRGRILAGNYLLLKQNYERHFVRAQRVRRLIADDFRRVFGDVTNGWKRKHVAGSVTGGVTDHVDLLLTPVTIAPAPLYRDFRLGDNRARTQEQDVCTQPVNLAGVPAISVPVCLSAEGLPIGLQLVAPSFGEARLLSAAKWLEQAVRFPYRDWDQCAFTDT